jgi:hypothetical protein
MLDLSLLARAGGVQGQPQDHWHALVTAYEMAATIAAARSGVVTWKSPRLWTLVAIVSEAYGQQRFRDVD